MSLKTAPPLNEILATAKSGMKESALALIYMRLSQYPEEHKSLLALAALTPDLEEGIDALEKILISDPANENAQRGLSDLKNRKETIKEKPSSEIFLGSEFVASAGKVIWIFRGVNKSISDAVENEVIFQKDLGWAATRAYNAPTRWAAAVYHRRDVLLSEKMTLEEARATKWTLSSLNQSTGELLDTHAIELKDLCKAVINSTDAFLVMAAATLAYQIVKDRLKSVSGKPEEKPTKLVTQKEEITKPPNAPISTKKKLSKKDVSQTVSKTSGRLQTYEGSSYLKKKELDALKKKEKLSYLGQTLIVIGLLISFGFFILPFAGIPLTRPEQWYWIGSGLAVMLLVNTFLVPRFDNAAQEYKNYLAGRVGEENFEKILKNKLSNDWFLFRNIDLPDKQGDIDAVLVGPMGIYACEVKAFKGRYRNNGNRWQYHKAGVWHNYKKSPSKQAITNATRLHNFLLENASIDIWVEQRIVWAGDNKLWIKKPAVRIWDFKKTKYISEDLNEGKGLDQETVEKITTALRMYFQGYKHTGRSIK